jgi:alcohol dehydrogenase
MTCTYLNSKVALMGAGCVREIGKYAKELGGHKVLIVSGKSRHGEDIQKRKL